MERILITGSSGFIGSYIAKASLAKGHYVIALGKSRKPSIRHVNCTTYGMDLLDKEAVDNCIKKEQPTVICHHASTTSFVHESFSMPQYLPRDTIASIHLLQAAVANNVKQFIFASSASVYSSRAKIPIKETAPLHPTSPLGISKMSIEAYCNYFASNSSLRCTTLRYFNVYGPGQRQGENAGIVPNVIQKALDKSILTIFQDGEQTRDFVHVEDVAAANLSVIEASARGIFNIASGKGVSIIRLVKTVEKLMEKKIETRFVEGKVKPFHSVASIDKIQAYTKWRPRVGFENGLQRTIAYYQGVS